MKKNKPTITTKPLHVPPHILGVVSLGLEPHYNLKYIRRVKR